ncbi:hypothetical protein BRD13_02145 [Halobacteriales archaeon SW_5_70_135]|nr:MAG: hypothetical protein BRD13_02145 [Halobacteriales archaeon SW_5_70_135]
MSLAEFVDDVREREKTLTVFTDDASVVEALRDFFEVQNVAVRRGETEGDGPEDFVVLHQEGEAVAVSTLADVREGLFLDVADPGEPTGGLRTTDAGTPDVIGSLGHSIFNVEGEDDMLLAQTAHYVADLAYRVGGGAVHTGHNRIAETDDGASRDRDVDRQLTAAGVELHVYGRPDGVVDEVVVHETDATEFETTRFAVFDGDGDDADKVALLVTLDDGDYRGFWTFEARIVDQILGYLRATYGGQ